MQISLNILNHRYRCVDSSLELPSSSVDSSPVSIIWRTPPKIGPRKKQKWWANILETKMNKVIPIGSMYGIFHYIWLIFMANVGKYTIHGSYGIWKGTVSKRKGKIVFQFHHLFREHSFVLRSGHQKWWALEHVSPDSNMAKSLMAISSFRGWDKWRTIHRNIILIQPWSSTRGMTWWYKNRSICHETFQLTTQQKARKRHVLHIFNCRPSLTESQSYLHTRKLM